MVWPQAVVQLCVVHLIRASLRYASRKYRVPLAKDLRPVYTAADEGAAAAALEAFAAAWGERYPARSEGAQWTASALIDSGAGGQAAWAVSLIGDCPDGDKAVSV